MVTDSAGNNNGTLVGNPTRSGGQVGNGLTLNGINDYVEVPNSAALNFGTGDFSISTWVKTTDNSGVDVILDKRTEASGPTRGYVLYTYNGRLSLQLADGSITNYETGPVIADGQWHQVTVTIDRDNPTGGVWYIDGVQFGTFNPTGRQGNLTNPQPLRIGRRSDSGNGGFFTGSLDEVQLFSRSLTVAEVLALYRG